MRAPESVVVLGLCWLANSMVLAADFPAMQKALDIPVSIAAVVDADSGLSTRHSGLPEYILIQDIHRHPEAQANIVALLLHACRRWGQSSIYIEGAYAGQAVARPEVENSLRTKLYDGILSGAEVASAMVMAGELQLRGLEDPAVYKANVEAYQSARNQESQALREIKTVRLLQATLDLSVRSLSPEQLDRLELLARLKLKPAEYAQYLTEKESMQLSQTLKRTLEAAERFYELADQRSEIFLEQARKISGSDPKVFVVGGFHTTDMARQLRNTGKTFVVLSPHVTRSGYDHLYAERMNETISALKLR